MNYPVIPRTFFSGDCFDAYRILGAHPCTDPNGAEGWRFAVWAPGATAVEVGAANLVNPFASRDIVRALPETMKKYGIENLNEIIGGAH